MTTHPHRSTAVAGLLLALLLVVGALVVAVRGTDVVPVAPTPSAPPVPAASPTPANPTAAAPAPGPAYPVRSLGALGERSRLVNGRGSAELRYVRTPDQATRLHLICSGCDAGTRLVDWPRGPLGEGPPHDPSDVTAALDTDRSTRATRLLLRAAPAADWTLVLTPFDAVPVHRATFDGLGEDVVAVRTGADLGLLCTGPARAETFARPAGRVGYASVETLRGAGGGPYVLRLPAGADLLVVVVGCVGRWTITVP